jgi:hypothetical protein
LAIALFLIGFDNKPLSPPRSLPFSVLFLFGSGILISTAKRDEKIKLLLE